MPWVGEAGNCYAGFKSNTMTTMYFSRSGRQRGAPKTEKRVPTAEDNYRVFPLANTPRERLYSHHEVHFCWSCSTKISPRESKRQSQSTCVSIETTQRADYQQNHRLKFTAKVQQGKKIYSDVADYQYVPITDIKIHLTDKGCL